MNLQHLRAIFFDIGGTLSHSRIGTPYRVLKMVKVLQDMGYIIDENKALEIFKRTRDSLRESIKDIDIEINIRYLIGNFLVRLGIRERVPILIDKLYDAYREAANEDRYLEPDAKEVIRTLKEKGFYIGIISNASDYKLVVDLLVKEGLFNLVDSLAVSSITVWKKPRKEIFEYALSQINVKPKEAAHVGNNLKRDVLGAKEIGMVAVWKVNDAEAVKELNETGIKPDIIIYRLSDLLDFL